ncbi:hypothetical protein M2243_002810 [Heliophilum fasciatum]|nr:hypothetical protein [Heliophilum fasciatum]
MPVHDDHLKYLLSITGHRPIAARGPIAAAAPTI